MTFYVLLLGKLIEHNISTGAYKKYYLFNGKLLALREGLGSGSTYRYLVTDHLGSLNTTLNLDGTVYSDLRYTPFGNQRWAINTSPTGARFTAQRLDDLLDLYNYNARYYDPAIARFISADTLIPYPNNPQSFNRFSYVQNNPVNRIDPTGHMDWDGDGEMGNSSDSSEELITEASTIFPPNWNSDQKKRAANGELTPEEKKELLDYYSVIHRTVQTWFMQKYIGTLIEVPIKGSGPKGGTGRADLVLGIEIWEVKHVSYYYNQDLKDSATSQLERYTANMPGIKGSVKSELLEGVRIPHPLNAKKEILIQMFAGNLGMIYYSEVKKQEQPQTSSEYALATDVDAFLFYLSIGLGAWALMGAGMGGGGLKPALTY